VQITSHPASEYAPHFSPDGKRVLFVSNREIANSRSSQLYEVPLDPVAVNEGKDPQLDAAIAQVLEELKTAKPIPLRTAPPFPTQVGK
jgi:hypothetical protein